MQNIRCNNVSFSYGERNVFAGFDMDASDINIISIIGPSSCGKSTLAKILAGKLEYDGEILLDYKKLSSYSKGIISLVDEKKRFHRDNLVEEMKRSLSKIHFPEREQNEQIKFFVDYFDIKELSIKPFKYYNITERAIASILVELVTVPYILILDDMFKYLDTKFKNTLIKFLNRFHISLINIVTDIEDVLYGEYIVALMKNGNVAVEGGTLLVLKEEKLLHRLGFNLPFMIDLSIQLGYYELIEDIYLDKKELVNDIWK